MQDHIQTAPEFLLKRYRAWKTEEHAPNQGLFDRLVDEGQSPPAMLISCCDSRVQITSVFGADPGDFFVHRNIANFVPPNDAGGLHHGTAAAVQYAITALKVSHVAVIGHSQCGGVKGCYDMCEGNAPALEDPANHVGRWIEPLRAAYERLPDDASDEGRVARLEREGVLLSLENLMTYPFVEHAVAAGELSLHGFWIDIRSGALEAFNPKVGAFEPV